MLTATTGGADSHGKCNIYDLTQNESGERDKKKNQYLTLTRNRDLAAPL